MNIMDIGNASQNTVRVIFEIQGAARGMEQVFMATRKLEASVKSIQNVKGEWRNDVSADELFDVRQQSVDAIRKSLAAASGSMIGLVRHAQRLRPMAKKLGVSMGEFRTEIEMAARRVRPFNFAMLGLLFGAMQIQRAIGGLFRDMFAGFRSAQEQNSAFNTTMSRLQARVEHVKFSFIDAFVNTPFFAAIMEAVGTLLDWLSGLDDKTKGWIMTILGVVLVLATVVFVWATMGLMIQAVTQSSIAWGAALGASGIVGKLILAWVWVKAIAIVLANDAFLAVGKFGGAIANIALRWAPIIVGALFVIQLIRKAQQFSWDWGAAFGYVSGQAGIMFGQLLRGFSFIVEAFASLITAIGGLIVDGIAGYFRQAINNIIDLAVRALRALNQHGLANRIARAKFKNVWNTDSTFAGLSSVEDFFNRIDESIVSRNDNLREQLGLMDSIFGVESSYADLLRDSDSMFSGVDLDSSGVNTTPGQITIGEININGAENPMATYDAFRRQLEAELRAQGLETGGF
jgi:hypothetical protein